MSAAEARELPGISMQLKSVVLQRMTFERLGKRPREAETGLEVRFSLSTRRPTEATLQVRLTLQLVHSEVFEGAVSYIGTFTRTGEPDANGEGQLRYFAAKVAPTILYPYIRETVTSVVVKSGLPALMLPIINFADVFDLDDVELAPVGGIDDEEDDR